MSQVVLQDEKQQGREGPAPVPTGSDEGSGQVPPASTEKKPKVEGKKGVVDRRRRKPGAARLSSEEESEGSDGEEEPSSEENLSPLSDSMEEDVLESLSETGTSGEEDGEEVGARGAGGKFPKRSNEKSTKKSEEGTRGSEEKGTSGSDEKGTRGPEEKSSRGPEEKGTRGSDEKGTRGSDEKGTRGSDEKGTRESDEKCTRGSEAKGPKELSPFLSTVDKQKRTVPRRPVFLAANFRTPVEDSRTDAPSGPHASPTPHGMDPSAQASRTKMEDMEEDNTLGRLLHDTRTQTAVHMACRLVAEEGYLLILKCFLDWLQSHPVVIATCAQVCVCVEGEGDGGVCKV